MSSHLTTFIADYCDEAPTDELRDLAADGGMVGEFANRTIAERDPHRCLQCRSALGEGDLVFCGNDHEIEYLGEIAALIRESGGLSKAIDMATAREQAYEEQS